MREREAIVVIPLTPRFSAIYHTHLGARAHILTFIKCVSCSSKHILSSEHHIKPNIIIIMSQKREQAQSRENVVRWHA